MSAFRPALVAFALLSGLAGTASAQAFASGRVISNGLVGGYPGYGYGVGGYYGGTNGFGNYGFPGNYSGFAGNSLNGYYPGRSFQPLGPQTANNMGGLINTIRTQTGRPNSYSYGSNYGVARRRRVR